MAEFTNANRLRGIFITQNKPLNGYFLIYNGISGIWETRKLTSADLNGLVVSGGGD